MERNRPAHRDQESRRHLASQAEAVGAVILSISEMVDKAFPLDVPLSLIGRGARGEGPGVFNYLRKARLDAVRALGIAHRVVE